MSTSPPGISLGQQTDTHDLIRITRNTPLTRTGVNQCALHV